ncbi:hypothetical protein N0Y54_30875 [Nostoc punctiforme UO1]
MPFDSEVATAYENTVSTQRVLEREQRDFVRSAKKGAIAKNLFICT